MARMRVFEVSKQLGIPAKDLIVTLQQLGFDVANSFNTVDADLVYRKIAEAAPQAKKPAATPVASQPQPTAKAEPAASPDVPPELQASSRPLATVQQAPPKPEPLPEPPKPKPAEAPARKPAPPADRKPAPHAGAPRQQGRPASSTEAAPAPSPKPGPSKGGKPHHPTKEKEKRPSPAAMKKQGAPSQKHWREALAEETIEPATEQAPKPAGTEDDYTSPSKRYDAIKQKSTQQARKGQKVTFLKKKGKKDRDAAAAEQAEAAGPQVRKTIKVSGPLTVKELSHETAVKSSDIIMFLMKEFNLMTTLNHSLDLDLVRFVCDHFGVGIEVRSEPGMDIPETAEEAAQAELELRPPVVTVMGHVDHGKTKLLDAIRHTNVVDQESGGITQHIGAYQIEHNSRKITFLDTPGHASFTALRARGAKVTDLAVLVVAADDGVMPQTAEAIDHARDANVPILVAINKIDKPQSNIDRVKRQLSEKGLQPEEWGGTTVMVEISAKMKTNIEDLLDMVFLVTDLLELKANPKRKAVGTVIEAQLDKGKGPTATVLIQNGSLYAGDYIVAGLTYGRIRAMENDRGETLPFAGPSTPVRIFGLDHVPESGDQIFGLEDEKTAREIVSKRRLKDREEKLRYEGRVSLDDLFNRIKDGQLKEFKIIIKGDVQGSVEAITQSLEGIKHEEVRVKVIRAEVGEVSETDVMLAAAAGAVILSFHTGINPTAQAMAQRERVDVRRYDIIYKLIDDVKMAMAGMLAPEYDEEYTGRVEVRKIFASSRMGNIAGCYVEDGEVNSGAIAVLNRDGREVYKGKLGSLKRFKDNVKNVQQGYECGVILENFEELREGDKIEFFKLVEKKRETI